MAGKKGASGGKRAGAGRKPKWKPDELIPTTYNGIEDTEKDSKSIFAFPKDLEGIPHAKEAWQFVISVDNQCKILNERHYGLVKSYCIAYAMQQSFVDAWKESGCAMQVISKGELKVNPVVKELEKVTRQVQELAEELGLTVLGEREVAKTVKATDGLSADTKKDNKKDDMFE